MSETMLIIKKIDKLQDAIEKKASFDGKKWFSLKEAALYTGLSASQIKLDTKKIRGDKPKKRRKYIFSVEDLDNYIKKYWE